MKLPSTSTHNRRLSGGFTLIEVTVVLGLIGIVAAFTAVVTLDSYRGFVFRSDRDTLIAALQRARSQGMNNVCLGAGCTNGKQHGVAITPDQYVIFQGTSYAARDVLLDEVLPRAGGDISLSPGSLSEVVFKQLSGKVALPGSFMLVDSRGHVSSVAVNEEGQITWTN